METKSMWFLTKLNTDGALAGTRAEANGGLEARPEQRLGDAQRKDAFDARLQHEPTGNGLGAEDHRRAADDEDL
jgi:hypothetical protein